MVLCSLVTPADYIGSTRARFKRGAGAIPSASRGARRKIAVGWATGAMRLLVAEPRNDVHALVQDAHDLDGAVRPVKSIRATAQELDIQYAKREGTRGTYEFVDPVFRAYVRLRGL
jgi:hypothetical protein